MLEDVFGEYLMLELVQDRSLAGSRARADTEEERVRRRRLIEAKRRDVARPVKEYVPLDRCWGVDDFELG